MSEGTLIEEIRAEREEIIELLERLITYESPTHRKDLVDDLAHFIAEMLRQSGANLHVERRSEVGDVIGTEWGDSQEGRILVLCHIDTVWEEGSLTRNPFRVEEGRIYGPGVFDMKSGVGATLKIQDYLSRGWIKPRKKIRFLYTTDEETGASHSRELIEHFASESDLVLVTEPPLPGGHLKTFRKGVARYDVRIQGKPAHSGLEPEKGINAVEELARQILEIHSLASAEEGTTISVNMVRGGTAENVVPEFAEAVIDARFRTIEEGQRIDRSIRGLPAHLKGTRIEVQGGIDRPPMVKTDRTRKLFRSAKEIAAELGIALQEGESGGSSDGNITAALGIPTLDGLGIPGDGAHAWHEHIELEALVPRIALLARLIERL